jgi:Family of unknown function (DUF6263)
MKRALLVGTVLLLSVGYGFTAAKAQQPSTLAPEKPVVMPKPSASRPTLALLTVGAAPRQVVRFRLAVNSKQVATMSMAINMGLSIAGKAMPTNKLPTTVLTFETLVNQIDPNGDIHYQFQYMNVEVTEVANLPPDLVTQFRTQLQKLKGIRGAVVVDSRGQTKSGKFVLPPELDSANKQMLRQITQSVEQLSSPVPEPALGVGAKWQVISAPKLNGIAIKQTTTYELVSFQTGGMTLNVTLAQQAPPQQMNATGLPKGRTMRLKSLSGAGKGQITVKFDRLMPIDSSMISQLRSEMESPNPPAGNMKMTTNTKMTLNLKSQ